MNERARRTVVWATAAVLVAVGTMSGCKTATAATNKSAQQITSPKIGSVVTTTHGEPITAVDKSTQQAVLRMVASLDIEQKYVNDVEQRTTRVSDNARTIFDRVATNPLIAKSSVILTVYNEDNVLGQLCALYIRQSENDVHHANVEEARILIAAAKNNPENSNAMKRVQESKQETDDWDIFQVTNLGTIVGFLEDANNRVNQMKANLDVEALVLFSILELINGEGTLQFDSDIASARVMLSKYYKLGRFSQSAYEKIDKVLRACIRNEEINERIIDQILEKNMKEVVF